MIAIPNQCITFDSPIDPNQVSLDENSENDLCVMYRNSDIIQLQFLRELSDAPVFCPLIDQSLIFELIGNGLFNTDINGWTQGLGGTWEWEDGKAIHGGGSTANFIYNVTGNGFSTKFLLTYEIFDRTTGTVTAGLSQTTGSPVLGGAQSGNGVITEIINLADIDISTLFFNPTSLWDGKIDNVSLTPLIESNDCWSFPGWLYELDGLSHTPGTTTPLTLSDALSVGQHYKLVIRSLDGESGHAILKNGPDQIGVLHEDVENYYFAATDTAFTLVPTSDYDGKVYSIDIYTIDSFNDGQIFLINEDESVLANLWEQVRYDRDWATLQFSPSAAGDDALVLDPGCYTITYYQTTGHSFAYHSNCIKVVTADTSDRSKLIRAWCEGEALGFLFADFFRLEQRLPLRHGNPSYPKTVENYDQSNGTWKKQYSKLGKRKTFFVEEAAHEIITDCLNVQLECDYLQINDTTGTKDYFCDDKELQVTGSKDGIQLLYSPVTFELRKQGELIYNRNAGTIPYTYLLRVLWAGTDSSGLAPWGELASYKSIDKFDMDAGDIMTVRLVSMKINDVQLLDQPQYLTFSYNGVSFSPDLVIATGVNGNKIQTAGPTGPTNFVQNVDEWINAMIVGGEVRFYDGMSVVEYIKYTTFEILIGVKMEQTGSYLERVYTEGGMVIDALGGDFDLNYSA